MADKRRLEEIKSRIKSGFGCLRYFLRDALDPNDKCVVEDIKLLENDIVYLIKQAERVQELEVWYHSYHKEAKLNNILKIQNKRYREALEFYADEEHYKEKLISEAQYDADGICISNDEYAPPIIYFDSGEKARQALEGVE